ncbi:RNase H domain-containing protein [Trichonephila clavipes]|nr:RNase H domain-containing protein [Trichonephila clavipes]
MNLKLFWINLDLGQKVIKSNTEPSIMRALVLEVLNFLYFEPEWLRTFNVGSFLPDSPNADAGIFSEIFSAYDPADRGTAVYGEIDEIRTSLSQLQCHLENLRVVILRGSRATLLVIVSGNNPKTQGLLDCHYHPKNLVSLEKTIVLQWVPAHSGVPGNEKTDFLVKKGVFILQKISRLLSFHSIKNLINRSIKDRV